MDGGRGGVEADLDGERVEGGQGGDPAGVFGGGQEGAVGVDTQAQVAPAGVGGQRPEIGAEQRLAAGKGHGEGAEGGYLVDEGERFAGGEFSVGDGAIVGAGHGKEAVAAAFVAAVGQLPVDAEQPPLLAGLGQQARQEIGGRIKGPQPRLRRACPNSVQCPRQQADRRGRCGCG